MHVLAVDGGKTKTSCAILDVNGNILAHSIGRGTGTSLFDPPVVEHNLRSIVSNVLKHSNLSVTDIDVASFSMCDIDTVKLTRRMEEMISRLGFKGKVLLEPDFVSAYYAATYGKPGVGVIAGTGSMAYGENKRGDKARAGGWGWLIDDEGSGVWIGAKALNAVAKAYDGTKNRTILSEIVCRNLNLNDYLDVINLLYQNGMVDVLLASRIAPLVDQAAERGDEHAIRILQQAAHELSFMTLAVSKKLELENEKHIVGCVGSVFNSSIVWNTFKRLIETEIEGAEVKGPYIGYVPLMGPVIIAFKKSLKESSEIFFETISRNFKNLEVDL